MNKGESILRQSSSRIVHIDSYRPDLIGFRNGRIIFIECLSGFIRDWDGQRSLSLEKIWRKIDKYQKFCDEILFLIPMGVRVTRGYVYKRANRPSKLPANVSIRRVRI